MLIIVWKILTKPIMNERLFFTIHVYFFLDMNIESFIPKWKSDFIPNFIMHIPTWAQL